MSRYLYALFACVLATAACGNKGPPPQPIKEVKKEEPKKNQALDDARVAVKRRDVDTADKKFEEAYTAEKKIEILEEWVDYLLHSGRGTKAVELAKTYYDGNATDAKGYALYAEALLVSGNGTLALDISTNLIALNESDAAGHEKRGRALLLVDKPDDGIVELRKAIQIDAKYAKYHIELGRALQANGKVDEAVLEFRTAVKLAPDDIDSYVSLGASLRDQAQLDEAKTMLDKAIEMDSESGRAYFEMGLLYNRQGKTAEAEAALSMAVQKAPNESLFWYAYGEIYRLQQRIEEAITAYTKAVELDPPYPKAASKLSQMLVDKKQYDDAEKFLTIAIRRDGHFAMNYFALGAVYAAKKKKDLAIENYQKFLELAPKSDPERPKAQQAIRALK